MPSMTVRISRESSSVLHELAARSKTSMQFILNQAIESFRRQQFLEGANKAYANLRKNSKKWKEELKERKNWDVCMTHDWEKS